MYVRPYHFNPRSSTVTLSHEPNAMTLRLIKIQARILPKSSTYTTFGKLGGMFIQKMVLDRYTD